MPTLNHTGLGAGHGGSPITIDAVNQLNHFGVVIGTCWGNSRIINRTDPSCSMTYGSQIVLNSAAVPTDIDKRVVETLGIGPGRMVIKVVNGVSWLLSEPAQATRSNVPLTLAGGGSAVASAATGSVTVTTSDAGCKAALDVGATVAWYRPGKTQTVPSNAFDGASQIALGTISAVLSPTQYQVALTTRTDTVVGVAGSRVLADVAMVVADQGRSVVGANIPAASIVSYPTPHFSCVMTSGSSTVVDPDAVATDVGALVSFKNAGFAAGTTVSSVNVGVSFVASHTYTGASTSGHDLLNIGGVDTVNHKFQIGGLVSGSTSTAVIGGAPTTADGAFALVFKDDQAAGQTALDKIAAAGGGTFKLPQAFGRTGMYALATTNAHGGKYGWLVGMDTPMTVAGDGRDLVTVLAVADVGGLWMDTLVGSEGSDGSTISGITMDTQTIASYESATNNHGNNNTLLRCRVLGGSGTIAGAGWRATPPTKMAGPHVALYYFGNKITDLIQSDRLNDAGIDMDLQSGGTTYDTIVHCGSRLAPFNCGGVLAPATVATMQGASETWAEVVLKNYDYTPAGLPLIAGVPQYGIYGYGAVTNAQDFVGITRGNNVLIKDCVTRGYTMGHIQQRQGSPAAGSNAICYRRVVAASWDPTNHSSAVGYDDSRRLNLGDGDSWLFDTCDFQHAIVEFTGNTSVTNMTMQNCIIPRLWFDQDDGLTPIVAFVGTVGNPVQLINCQYPGGLGTYTPGGNNAAFDVSVAFYLNKNGPVHYNVNGGYIADNFFPNFGAAPPASNLSTYINGSGVPNGSWNFTTTLQPTLGDSYTSTAAGSGTGIAQASLQYNVTGLGAGSGTGIAAVTLTTTPPPPPPVVVGIAPAAGPAAGGTVVVITGTGFQAAGLAVFFETSPATGVTYLSPTSVSAISPEHLSITDNVVDVTVVTAVGTSPVVVGDQFTYGPPFTIPTNVVLDVDPVTVLTLEVSPTQ